MLRIIVLVSALSFASSVSAEELLLSSLRNVERLAVDDQKSRAVPYVDVVGKLRNVLSVSASEGVVLILDLVSLDASARQVFYIVDRVSGSVQEFAAPEDSRLAALSADGETLAIAICSGTSCRVAVARIPSIEMHNAVYESKHSIQHLAWSPDGTMLAIGSDDGLTAIVDSRTGVVKESLTGTGAAWAADSRRVALVRNGGKELGIEPVGSGEYVALLRRWFWQARLVGPVYWSHASGRIAFTTPSGLAGYELTCHLITPSSGDQTTLAVAGRFCGPWLPE